MLTGNSISMNCRCLYCLHQVKEDALLGTEYDMIVVSDGLIGLITRRDEWGMAFRFTQKTAEINGELREYHVVEHDGAAAIIPWHKGKLTLVRQTRPAVERQLLEIPAGALEKGEDPLEAAQRELAEETGWRAKSWHKLVDLYLAPGYSTEVLHLYLATDLTMGEQNLDDSEDIEVVHLKLSEVLTEAENGNIRDAKTLVALFHLNAWLEEHEQSSWAANE